MEKFSESVDTKCCQGWGTAGASQEADCAMDPGVGEIY